MRVYGINRSVLTIYEYIGAEKSSEIGSDAPVRINESANGGVIVPALEVVEACFGIEVVAPVADGILLGEGTFGGEDIAPCVVGVGGKDRAVRGNDLFHVALLVLYEDAFRFGFGCLIGVAYEFAAGAVVEVKCIVRAHVRHELAAVPDVAAGAAVHRLFGAQSGVVVGKRKRRAVLLHGRQLPPALPRHAPAAVVRRVAYAVVGYGFAVVRRQEIAPYGVAVGIAYRDGIGSLPVRIVVFGFREDVPAEVVGIVPRLVRRSIVLPDELVQAVVGVGRCVIRQDIAVCVVSIRMRERVPAERARQGRHLRRSVLGIYVAVGIGRGKNGISAVLDGLAGNAAIAVIRYGFRNGAIGRIGRTMVIIVGVRIGIRPQCTTVIDAGSYRGDVLVRVVAPRNVRDEIRPIRHNDARQAVHGIIAVVFRGEKGLSGYCAIFEREGLLLDFAYLPAGIVSIRIANAAGIRKVRIPPQQIVRLGIVVILPPEAVAIAERVS